MVFVHITFINMLFPK